MPTLLLDELQIIRAAIREASEALDDWELETRMGCRREQLRALAHRVEEISEAAESSS